MWIQALILILGRAGRNVKSGRGSCRGSYSSGEFDGFSRMEFPFLSVCGASLSPVIGSFFNFLGTGLAVDMVVGVIGLWLLKKSVIRSDLLRSGEGAGEFFFLFLNGDCQRCCRLAEEPHQSLEVLGSRPQKELLPHELQAA